MITVYRLPDSDSDTQDIASEAHNPLSNQINESWILKPNLSDTTPLSLTSIDTPESQLTNDFSSTTLQNNKKSRQRSVGHRKLSIPQHPPSSPTPSHFSISSKQQFNNSPLPRKRGRPPGTRQTTHPSTSSDSLPHSAQLRQTTHSYNLRRRKQHDTM